MMFFKFHRHLFFLAALVLAASLQAGIRCDLSAESCIDYTSITTAVNITVPVNTTRIAASPMSVCMGEVTGTKIVDFVFESWNFTDYSIETSHIDVVLESSSILATFFQ